MSCLSWLFATKRRYRRLRKRRCHDGASKTVKLGLELEKYYKTPVNNLNEQAALLEALEIKMHAYVTSIDKKKVKKYPEFEKAFLDTYLRVAHLKKEDAKRHNANAAIYKTELTKFFTAVQALSPHMNAKGETMVHKKDTLEKFKSGPVRGVSAVGKSVKGVDVRKIDEWLGKINSAVQALPKEPTDQAINDFIAATNKTAEEIRKEAVALGLF